MVKQLMDFDQIDLGGFQTRSTEGQVGSLYPQTVIKGRLETHRHCLRPLPFLLSRNHQTHPNLGTLRTLGVWAHLSPVCQSPGDASAIRHRSETLKDQTCAGPWDLQGQAPNDRGPCVDGLTASIFEMQSGNRSCMWEYIIQIPLCYNTL